MFKFASLINRDACNIDDNPEKERIALKNNTILFLFILSRVSSIEGIENSIKPLYIKENSLFIAFDIILQGIEDITIIPNILIRVLDA